MAFSYGKTTYRKLFQSVAFPMRKDTHLASLGMEAVIVWVLEAEEEITDRLIIEEEYKLRLLEGQVEYPLRDRPPITAITNATPMVVTAEDHGLVANDGIFSTRVAGISANGRFVVGTVPDSDSFQLKNGGYIVGASNEDVIVITTELPHERTTGQTVTIALVEGNTNANGSHVITVIDDTSFSIPVAGNDDYTGGGVFTIDTVGDVAYVSGGRYWKDTEIPTFFHSFRTAERTYSNFKRYVRLINIEEVLSAERRNEYSAFTGFESPSIGALWQRDGKKYLRLYPAPIEDRYLTLFGRIRITPEDWYEDTEDIEIHLSGEYTPMIKLFVKSKLFEWLGEDKKAAEEMSKFEGSIQSFVEKQVSQKRMEVVYE